VFSLLLRSARTSRIRTLCVAILVAVGATVTMPSLAFAGPNEGDFFSAANSARSTAGLYAYAYAGDLAYAARAQAERMAASGVLAHNPNLGGSVSNWQGLAENVGTGTDWATIQQAFMNSPEHRGAILDSSYTQMGVGTAVDKNGILWVSEVFRLPAGATTTQTGSSDGSAPSSSTTSSSSSTSGSGYYVPPAPTPTEILRGKIRDARSKLAHANHSKHHVKHDPLTAALDYSTVMSTVGG